MDTPEAIRINLNQVKKWGKSLIFENKQLKAEINKLREKIAQMENAGQRIDCKID